MKHMKKTAAHSATSLNTTNTQTLNPLQLGRTYFGTGWRIVVPVVVATFFGTILDAAIGTKPWLTLVGLVLGFMVAGALVKHQGGNVATASKK